MKLFIYAVNPDEFLRGDYRWSLTASDCGDFDNDGWVLVGEVDVELKADKKEIVQRVLDCLDAEEQRVKEEMNEKLAMIATKRQTLLALPHKEDAA